MNITETFLKLTSRTYPHGSESELFSLLPDYFDFDEFGNRYVQIGDSTSCMFTSHLDTATSQKVDVKHIIDGKICKTDGTSILGADDKAGVTIMLWMIWNKVPGLYYFFLGEEVGCVGSKALASKFSTKKIESITKVISFDRRGKDSVITYQASSRCCSDTFANALAGQLNKNKTFNYKPDPTGLWTDSAQFTKIYPECTNISVGYRNEHTNFENQDLEHLEQLADTCVSIDWENLPVERDPKVVDQKYRYWDDYDSYWGGGYDSDGYGTSWSRSNSNTYVNNRSVGSVYVSNRKQYFWDKEMNHVSAITFLKKTEQVCDIELCEERLDLEKSLIAGLLEDLEVEYYSFTWDGLKLKVKHDGNSIVECSREELQEFITELNFWKDVIYKDKSSNAFDYKTENDYVF